MQNIRCPGKELGAVILKPLTKVFKVKVQLVLLVICAVSKVVYYSVIGKLKHLSVVNVEWQVVNINKEKELAKRKVLLAGFFVYLIWL